MNSNLNEQIRPNAPDMTANEYVHFELLRANMELAEAIAADRHALPLEVARERLKIYDGSKMVHGAPTTEGLVELGSTHFEQFTAEVGHIAASVTVGQRSIGFYQHKIRKLTAWQIAHPDEDVVTKYVSVKPAPSAAGVKAQNVNTVSSDIPQAGPAISVNRVNDHQDSNVADVEYGQDAMPVKDRTDPISKKIRNIGVKALSRIRRSSLPITLNTPKIDTLDVLWQPRAVSEQQRLERQGNIRKALTTAEETGIETRISSRQLQYAYGKAPHEAVAVLATMRAVGYGEMVGHTGTETLIIKPDSHLRIRFASQRDNFSPESITAENAHYETHTRQMRAQQHTRRAFDESMRNNKKSSIDTKSFQDMYGSSEQESQIALRAMHDLAYGDFTDKSQSILEVHAAAYLTVRSLLMHPHLNAEIIKRSGERSSSEQALVA